MIRGNLILIGLLFLGLTKGSAQNFPLQVKDGQLHYITDVKGNRILDYSYCGYQSSERMIPDVKNVISVIWKAGDNTRRIQKAIDYVSSLSPDKSGFRGAILLGEGVFELENSLHISTSGIVIRGVDRDKTVLLKKGVDRGALLYVEGKNDLKVTDTLTVSTPYVAVNEKSFQVSGNVKLSVGDRIQIVRPSSREWIALIGCDIFGGGISSLGWKPGDIDITWDRAILKSDGGTVTVDAPLTVALDNKWGEVKVLRYKWSGRIAEAGVENLTLASDYNKQYLKDEDHCWMGVSIENAENCWVRRVNFKNFAGSAVMVQHTASKITVEDCISRDPISEIGGMRRCTFFTMGQQTLFQRCYSEHGIHDFSAGFCAAGPNAFVQCESWESLGFSGSIDSWATGLLFDIVNIDGNNLSYKNLGQDKNGAGWNTANSLFWQCTASEIECYSPASDAKNRAYGCWAQFSGNGDWDESNNHVQPRSFFYAQLSQRLGVDCLERGHILPRETNATSSPAIEVAMQLAKEAYTPRLTLEKWITDGTFSAPVSSAKLIAVDDVKLKREAVNVQVNHEYRVINGHLVIDGKLLVGGRSEVPWWNGNLTSRYLNAVAKPHVTRFVPGREGMGLTDRIDSTVTYMVRNNILLLDHNYGLWYDRRRDDHERVRRCDGDVWAPFYEQPFARCGEGTAWDGLSKYDLARPNLWYWHRLKEFATKGAEKGLLLFHENYFQHNIIEAGAHWVDCPWRTANNINNTGFPEPVPFAGDKRVFMADMFYDISNPVRRELHRRYIRQCLDNFADNPNVIQLIGAEFTGPLPFVQFWIDVIGEWRKESGKHPLIALSTTKDVQDAILNDPERSKWVDIIDIRYWHYNTNDIYAPEGGKNMAPRQYMRKMKVGKVSFAEAYRAVSEYRIKYPEKAVTYNAQNYPEMAWAVFMAGGSCSAIPVKDEAFLKDAAEMQVENSSTDNYQKLVKSDTGCIIYSHSEDAIPVNLPNGKYTLNVVNPSDGVITVREKAIKINGLYLLDTNGKKDMIYWFHRL